MNNGDRIVYFAEPLPGGRGQLLSDVVIDGKLVESNLPIGSPAPIKTVREHEQVIPLNPPDRQP